MAGFGPQAVTKVPEAETERRFRSVIPLTGGSIGAFGFFVLGIVSVIEGVREDIGAAVSGLSEWPWRAWLRLRSLPRSPR